METILLLVSLLPGALIGPFVFRVCEVKTPSEYTVFVKRTESKVDASMCAVIVGCEKADFDVMVSNAASMSLYLSKDSDSCK